MPLASISKHGASQCTARAKSTKRRCLNPAAHGCRTCRLHGARNLTSIKRGSYNLNYRHGIETLEAKHLRSEGLARLREIANDLIKRGLIRSKRTVGSGVCKSAAMGNLVSGRMIRLKKLNEREIRRLNSY